MPGLIQNPEVAQRLQKRLGIRQGVVAPVVTDEVVPVVLVEDTFNVPDYSSTGRRRAMGVGSIGPSPGLYSIVGVVNPVASQVNLIVDRLWVSGDPANTDPVELKLTDIVFGFSQARGFVNDHIPGSPVGDVQANNGASPAGNAKILWRGIASVSPNVIDVSFVIRPGRALYVVTRGFAPLGELNASFLWDEVTVAP